MKLLMITGLGSAKDLASGKKGAFYNTLEEFSKYWERIDIIAPKIKTRDQKQEVNLFGNVFVHISPWPLIFHPFWFLKKGVQIYKEQKFDLMTVHESPPFYNGIGARLLWWKIRVPYILEIHHIPGYPKAGNQREWWYSRLWLWKAYWSLFGFKALAVRVVNKNQTLEFLKKVGVPEHKIKYIPSLYINLEIFKPLSLQKKYDLIFVGRLEMNKGIHLLLKAIELLIFNFQFPIQCLIVGDGPLKENLKFKIKNLKLQDNVLLYSWAKDSREVAELINKSRILVMSSFNEGGPRVVGEALACGVPVLATPVGIVPDLLKNGLGGEIIDWEADDIAHKAEGLLNDPVKYQRYSQSGPEIAEQFERKVMIQNYADKLKELI